METEMLKDTETSAEPEEKKDGRKHGKKKRIIVCVILVLAVAAVAAGGWLYIDSLAYKVCRVEAGVEVEPQDFLKKENAEAYFTQESAVIDKNVPGEYHIVIKNGLFTHQSILVITDSVAPTAEPVFVQRKLQEVCAPEEFVTNIVDATLVDISYKEEPDFTKVGEQEVAVVLRDQGGNETVVQSQLFVSSVQDEVVIEAGSEPPSVEDFIIGGQEYIFLSSIEDIDTTVPKEHKVRLKVDGAIYESVLKVEDTIAPVVSVQDINSYTLVPRKAEDFVTSVEDVTETVISYVKEPNLKTVGMQEVSIAVTDAGGNETVKTAKLTLQTDTEAPVITGAQDMTVIIGSAVSYKKHVKATDNCMEGLKFTVDSKAVNLNAEGVYPLTYIASDCAGHTVSETVQITVKPRTYDINEVNAMIDGILAQIAPEGMSQLDKAQAIFNYVKKNVTYISHSDKGNWVKAAYEGLVDRKGDCYVYASLSKAMLTRAGITNMDIVKIPARTQHYWNLVDVGGGWCHFDTTPRKDRPTIFMWSEPQLMQYSAMHGNSHNYDHSLYPVVN